MGQSSSSTDRHRAEIDTARTDRKHSASSLESMEEERAENDLPKWFHGDCAAPIQVSDASNASAGGQLYYNVPKLDCSFSDDEEDNSTTDCFSGRRARGRTRAFGRAVTGTFRSSSRHVRTSYSPVIPSRGQAVHSRQFERKRAKPPVPAKPTELDEVRCLSYLMSDEQKTGMELAHGWCPDKHSPNISLLPDKPLTFYRKPVAQSTDAALSTHAYSRGVHIFEITWPSSQRGTHPLVGITTEPLPLQGRGYVPLLGNHSCAWAWDLRRNCIMHNGQVMCQYPCESVQDLSSYECPDKFLMVMDMDRHTVSFQVDSQFLGVAFSGLFSSQDKEPMYAAVSAVWGSCEIKLRYMGGSTGRMQTLQQLCRKNVRHALTIDRIAEKNVDQLPIPRMMKKYVLCTLP